MKATRPSIMSVFIELPLLQQALDEIFGTDAGHVRLRHTERYSRLAALFAAPLLPDAAGFSIPCIPIQRTKASNQPVLVVSFGYIPKPCPPCS